MHECPRCGGPPTFTGASRFVGGRTVYEFRCSCGEEGWMEAKPSEPKRNEDEKGRDDEKIR